MSEPVVREWDDGWVPANSPRVKLMQREHNAAVRHLLQRVEKAEAEWRSIIAKWRADYDAVEVHMRQARTVVNEQAEDHGLWFVPKTITEDYLQKALRRLHEAIEGKSAMCPRSPIGAS